MYQKPDYAQTDIYDLNFPFGGHLDENNRWVILGDHPLCLSSLLHGFQSMMFTHGDPAFDQDIA